MRFSYNVSHLDGVSFENPDSEFYFSADLFSDSLFPQSLLPGISIRDIGVTEWLDFETFSPNDIFDDGKFDLIKGDDGVLFSTGAGDTIPGDITTTEVILVGGRGSGVRNSGTDTDWFRIDLVAGQEYTFFMLRDAVGGVDPHGDPWLRVFSPDGLTELASNDDTPSGGQNSRITFTATTTDTYFLEASGWTTQSGGYTIYAEESNTRADFTTSEIAFFLTDQFSLAAYWDQATITYNMSAIPDGTGGTDDVQNLIVLALQAWAEVTGLNFVETSGTGDITFINDQSGAYSSSSYGTNSAGDRIITSSTINVSQTQWIDTYGDDVNSYSYQTYLHEIGHTIGLGHGGPYNGNSTYGTDNVYLQDTWNHTVMSYHSQSEAGTGTNRLVLGLQVADLLAIHDLYGAAATTRGGNTVYGFNTTETGSIYDFAMWNSQGIRPPSFAIYDTGGIDTLDVSGYASDQIINLTASGDFLVYSSIGVQSGVNPLINLLTIAVGTVIENAIGGSGDDTITGNDANNDLTGGIGDDILNGGAGVDYAVFSGVLANYTVTDIGGGVYTVTDNVGTDGVDTLSFIEFLRFADGDFDITTLAPAGGPVFTEGDDTENGTSGDDVLDALGGIDIVHGLGGNDTIYGGAGDDQLFGDDGNDDLYGGLGADVLDGGAGHDRAFYSQAAAGLRADLFNSAANTGEAAGDSYSSIEALYGSIHNDILSADHSGVDLVGLAGNDQLIGRNGRDRLFGGDGNDRLDGGRGNDDLHGNAGIDTFVIRVGAGKDRIFTYEQGIDIIEFGGGPGSFSDLSITITGGNTVITHFNGVTSLIGFTGTLTAADFVFLTPLPSPSGNNVTTNLTAGNDNVSFGIDNDTVNGLAGNDIIRGGIGDDILNGGDGNDQLFGGLGADHLDGGAGIDRASYTTASSGVTVNLINPALNTGEAAGDTYSSIENIFGTIYDDILIGDAGDNDLQGLGDDDQLIGADGDDRLFGGDGDDRLTGGRGDDDLFGGAGSDTFVFGANSGTDRIFGFEDGLDIIQFQSGPTQFSDLTITFDGADSLITWTNRSIELIGFDATALTDADFLF